MKKHHFDPSSRICDGCDMTEQRFMEQFFDQQSAEKDCPAHRAILNTGTNGMVGVVFGETLVITQGGGAVLTMSENAAKALASIIHARLANRPAAI